jgi:hypothetical protein
VAKKELNLLQFAAGGATEPSAPSKEIMRYELGHTDLPGERPCGSMVAVTRRVPEAPLTKTFKER